MAILRNLFCFFGQFVGLLIFVCGLSQGISLAEYLLALRDGLPLDVGTLAGRIAACTGPTLIGLLIFFGIGAMRRWLADRAQREAEFPEQPWMWRADWAARHIRLSNRAAVITLLIAWALYLGIAAPIAVLGASIKNPGVVYSFAGAVGLFLLGFSRMLWINRRWNTAELRLANVPGIIGGPLTGGIVLKEVFPEGSVFRVCLKCERTTHSSRGKNSHTSTDILWQDEKLFDRTLKAGEPGSTAIPVYFAIPYGEEPTSVESPVHSRGYRRGTTRSHINWWVEVSLRDDRQMRSAKFEVPVFMTAESSPSYVAEEEKVAGFLERPEAEDVLSKSFFHREETPDGVQLRFSMFNGETLAALVIMLALCSLIVAEAFHWAPPPLCYFFALIPGVLALLMLVGIFQMLMWGSRVLIAHEEIEIEAGFLGLRNKLTFPRKSPPTTRVAAEHEGGARRVFAVSVTDAEGKRVPLIRHLDSRQDADAVDQWLRSEWSLKSKEKVPTL